MEERSNDSKHTPPFHYSIRPLGLSSFPLGRSFFSEGLGPFNEILGLEHGLLPRIHGGHGLFQGNGQSLESRFLAGPDA